MPYLDLPTARLYYEDEGEGPETLVFGHSMLFNLRMFDDQVRYFKGSYRCVRFDFRGQGKSQVTESGYDLEALTEDVAEFIRKLNCGPCHFVGFSMGGMVALRLAIRYPELIKTLILIDTSAEPEPGANALRNKAMLLVVKVFGLKPLGGRVMQMFFGRSFLRDPNRRGKRSEWKSHFLSNHRKGILKVVDGVLDRKSVAHRLPDINHAAIVMVGEKDGLTDLSKAQTIHSGLQNSTLEIIPRAGHMSPVEEPDIVNRAIERFLQGQLMGKGRA